jgi:hypothetical protein
MRPVGAGAGATPTTTRAHAPSPTAPLLPTTSASIAVTPAPRRSPLAPKTTTRVEGPLLPASPAPLALTMQDLKCPGRWRQFSADNVTWIESLIASRPLRLSAWQDKLAKYEDRDFLLYVVEHGLSLTNGTAALPAFRCRNCRSAYEAAAQVDAALEPDIRANRIFRPYAGDSSSYVHALGAVPKTTTTVRVIHDHSWPFGRSLMIRFLNPTSPFIP